MEINSIFKSLGTQNNFNLPHFLKSERDGRRVSSGTQYTEHDLTTAVEITLTSHTVCTRQTICLLDGTGNLSSFVRERG